MPGLQTVALLIFLNGVAYFFVTPLQTLFASAPELEQLMGLIQLAYYSLLLSLALALLLLLNSKLKWVRLNETLVSSIGAALNRLGLVLCVAVMVMMEYARHSVLLNTL